MEQMSFAFTIQTWTVTKLTKHIHELIDSDENLKSIWVSGEISNLSKPSSGHIYFTLKDANASLKCVMWKSDTNRLRMSLSDGMEVEAFGSIGVYEIGGQYQLYAQVIQTLGEGALFQEYLRLKDMFEREGLFNIERKRKIPEIPKIIGVVTSSTGAAIKDILNVIKRRLPTSIVILSPCLVQGENAPEDIEKAIENVIKIAPPDVIILARGGGSFEDLWAFNTEIVVRAVAKSPIPIITGIGHEIDFTLSDFASDLRAPTPSAAAELATPITVVELRENLENYQILLMNYIEGYIKNCRDLLAYSKNQIIRYSPEKRIASLRQDLDEMDIRLKKAFTYKNQLFFARIHGFIDRLTALSPVDVINRGYSIVTYNGKVVSKKSQVKSGDNIQIRVTDGYYGANVTGSE